MNLIDRQTAIDAVMGEPSDAHYPTWYADIIRNLPSVQPTIEPEPRWIPVTTRPMSKEEREHCEEDLGLQLDDADAVFFDCELPYDGQEIWICFDSGVVSEDICERDDFIGLEGNGDWLDVVAWMPRHRPKPYKGDKNV